MRRGSLSRQTVAKSVKKGFKSFRSLTSLTPSSLRTGSVQAVTKAQPRFLQNPLYNFLPENQNPNNVVSLICSKLRCGSDKVTVFGEDVCDLIPHLGSHEVSRVLLRCQSNAKIALEFFNWVKDEIRVDLNMQNYSIIVHVLVWCKNFSQGMKFLSEMIVFGGRDCSGEDMFEALMSCRKVCVFDPVIFDMLIKAYVKVGKVKEGYVAFRKIGEAGFVPDVVAMNCLLNGLSMVRWDDVCWEVYDEMVRIGVAANSFTFNILIRILCRNGDMSKVNEFLDRMEDEGFHPDVVTYNTLINNYCRRGKVQDAFHLYKIMYVRSVLPDLVTYTALMNGLCKTGNTAEAHQLLNNIVDRGLSPDVVMYNTLIAGYCKEGKMNESRVLLHSMIGNGIQPDNFTFRVLVEGYWKVGKLISALNLVEEFRKFHFSIPHDVYKFLTLALCKEDHPFAAENLLERSVQDDYKPDNDTYSALVGALCRTNHVNDALLLKDKLVYKNCQLDLEGYKTTIGFLCKIGRPDDAKKVMINMVESSVNPDVTICKALVDGYCNVGEVEIAESVLTTFATDFQIFDCDSFNIVVETLSEEGNVQKLLHMQEKMLKLGFTPNKVTCKYIIGGLQKTVKFRKNDT